MTLATTLRPERGNEGQAEADDRVPCGKRQPKNSHRHFIATNYFHCVELFQEIIDQGGLRNCARAICWALKHTPFNTCVVCTNARADEINCRRDYKQRACMAIVKR